jgi:opacity protein-like surface antigen
MKFNMISKLFLVVLLLTTNSFSLDKLFIGVNAGYLSSKTETDELKSNIRDPEGIQKDNPYGGIFMGYNHSIEGTPVFVGLEVSGQMYDMNASKEKACQHPYMSYQASVRSKTSAAAVVKLGISVSNALIYGKAGLSYALFLATITDKGHTAPTNPIFYRKYHRYAPVIGLGVDFSLNKNWAIGVDYTVASYASLKVLSSAGHFGLSSTIQMKSLRLTYSF